MKKFVLTTIIIASLLMTTSCKDQNSVTTEPDAVSIENPLVVKAQTPKSVLTLVF